MSATLTPPPPETRRRTAVSWTRVRAVRGPRRRPAADRLLPALAPLAVAAVLLLVAFVGRGGLQLGRMTVVELLLVALGGLAAAAALWRSRSAATTAGGLTVAVFAVLVAVTAASVTWALDPGAAWLETNRTVAYFAAFVGAVSLARLAPHSWAALLGGVLLATSVVSAYAMLTKIFPESLNASETYARLREPYGYWNAVGLSGVLALPAALWLGARREGAPLVNALAGPAVAIAVAVALLSYSRGALVAGIAGAVLWFALVPLRLRGAAVLLLGGAGGAAIAIWAFGQDGLAQDRAPVEVRSPAGTELAILVVAVLLLVYLATLVGAFLAAARPPAPRARRRAGIALLVAAALVPIAFAGALTSTERGLDGTLSSAWASVTDPNAGSPSNAPGRLTAVESVRGRYWDEARRMFDDKPLTGFGADGYAAARPRYQRDLLDAKHAHSYIAQTAAELGLIGLITSLVLLIVGLWATVSTLRGRTGPERVGILTLAVVAVVFGVHSAIDWTWYVPGTAVVGLVAAGWVAGRGPVAGSRRAVPLDRRVRSAAVAGTVLLTAAAAWAVIEPARAERTVQQALEASSEGRGGEARRLTERAYAINPLSPEPLLALAAIEQQGGDERAAERTLIRATREHPWQWQTWLRLAEQRYRQTGDLPGALRAIRRATYLNPREFEVTQLFIDIARTLGPKRTRALIRKTDRGR